MARLGRAQHFKPLLQNKIRGTIAFSSVLADSVTATDSLLRSIARTLSETATATDLITSIKLISAIFSEAVTATDGIVRDISRTLSDAITSTDSIVRDIARSLAEAVTGSDIFSSSRALFVTLTENVTASDTLRRLLNGVSTFWDNITKSAASVFSNTSKSTSSWINQDRS